MPKSQVSQKHGVGANAELFRALGNPLKKRILYLLVEMEASPAQVAAKLDEDLSVVARHVRELAAAKLVKVVRRTRARGGSASVYKTVARPILEAKAWEEANRLLREIHSTWAAQLLLGDLVESINSGVFDARTGRAMLRIPAVVDEQGFEEIEPAAAAFLEAIEQITVKSTERMAESGEAGINVTVGALAFESAPR